MINYSVSGSCKFKMNHPKVIVSTLVLYIFFQAIKKIIILLKRHIFE